MRSFEIFADSASNLTEEIIDEYNIGIVPYTCTVNGKDIECYEKGVPFADIAKKIYAAMREGAETKTTLVNAQKIIDAVTPTLEAGRDVMFVTISSNISGTFNQALTAEKLLKEKFPERKFVPVDSFHASMGEGLHVLYAARMAEEGATIEECKKWIDDHRLNMHGVCAVDTLKYLKKSGRISATLAIAGTILNIKPIIFGDETGKLAFLCNERGRKKAIAKLVELFKDNVIDPENQTIAIAHADCYEDALDLAEKIKELGANDVIINDYDICTGSHAGPGILALFFLGNERGKKQAKPSGSRGFAPFKKHTEA